MFSISQRTMLAAAVFAATTGAALAQAVDPAQVRAEATAANKAGLEVRAEGKAAHAAHQDAHGDQAIPEPATVSTRNRAEVKAETAKAVRAGQVSRGEMG